MTLELSKLRAIAEAAIKVDEYSPSRVVFDNSFNPATALELLDLLEKAREFAAFVVAHSAADTYNNEAAKEFLALLGQKGSGDE